MSLHTRSTHQRWADIEKQVPEAKEAKKVLYDSITEEQDSRKVYSKNIENFVGTVKVPLGVVGPLKVKTSLLTREYYIPLATTEAALLASIGRGCKTLSLAGGVTSRVVDQRVQRAPRFEFGTIDQAIKFEKWISSAEMLPKFQEVASTTTRHGKIINIKPFIQGNHVSVKFEFSTGEAIGQNMVSIASQQVVNFIRKQNPEGLTFSVLEGGLGSDKQGTFDVLQHARGRKVVVECTIPKESVEKDLKVTTDTIVRFRNNVALSDLAVGQPGTITGNVANVIAAMYIACGQDAACVAEGQVGFTRFEKTDKGDLYVSMTFPGLLTGIIGGGTSLPSQRAGLSILGCKTSNEFAEVVGAVCLAGELSLCAAICSDDFAHAHQKFARL